MNVRIQCRTLHSCRPVWAHSASTSIPAARRRRSQLRSAAAAPLARSTSMWRAFSTARPPRRSPRRRTTGSRSGPRDGCLRASRYAALYECTSTSTCCTFCWHSACENLFIRVLYSFVLCECFSAASSDELPALSTRPALRFGSAALSRAAQWRHSQYLSLPFCESGMTRSLLLSVNFISFSLFTHSCFDSVWERCYFLCV